MRLDGHVLYRESIVEGEKVRQLIVPLVYGEIVLMSLHDDAGHQGRGRTLYLVKLRFFWLGVYKDVEKRISTCKNCILGKSKTKPVELGNCKMFMGKLNLALFISG